MPRSQRIWVVTLGTVLHVLASLCLVGVTTGTMGQPKNPLLPSPSTAASSTLAPVATRPSTSTPAPVAPPPATTSAPPPPASALPPPPGRQPDPRYATCAEVKVHGLGPYYRGQDVEYGWYRDQDNDGIACE